MHQKIILYIATSLDGFIAKEDGNIDWLTKYENSVEDYGFKDMYDKVGTVLIGGSTNRQIEDPHKDKEVYIFSKRKSEQKAENKKCLGLHRFTLSVKKWVEKTLDLHNLRI